MFIKKITIEQFESEWTVCTINSKTPELADDSLAHRFKAELDDYLIHPLQKIHGTFTADIKVNSYPDDFTEVTVRLTFGFINSLGSSISCIENLEEFFRIKAKEQLVILRDNDGK